jgi:hypothetical protein
MEFSKEEIDLVKSRAKSKEAFVPDRSKFPYIIIWESLNSEELGECSYVKNYKLGVYIYEIYFNHRYDLLSDRKFIAYFYLYGIRFFTLSVWKSQPTEWFLDIIQKALLSFSKSSRKQSLDALKINREYPLITKYLDKMLTVRTGDRIRLDMGKNIFDERLRFFDSFSVENADELYETYYEEDYIGHVFYSNFINKMYGYYNSLESQRQRDIFYLYLKSEFNVNILSFLKNKDDKDTFLEIIAKVKEICIQTS